MWMLIFSYAVGALRIATMLVVLAACIKYLRKG